MCCHRFMGSCCICTSVAVLLLCSPCFALPADCAPYPHHSLAPAHSLARSRSLVSHARSMYLRLMGPRPSRTCTWLRAPLAHAGGARCSLRRARTLHRLSAVRLAGGRCICCLVCLFQECIVTLATTTCVRGGTPESKRGERERERGSWMRGNQETDETRDASTTQRGKRRRDQEL